MLAFRKLTLAALSIAFCASAWSQTAVPAWAKQDLLDLQNDGLVQGYPGSSEWMGRRAATRYEMAVLIHDVWARLSGRLEELKRPQPETHTEDLKAEIESVRQDLAAIRSMGKDLGKLNKLMVEFEPELTQLGLNYEILRRQYKDLEPRVSALEAARLPICVSGDLNILMLGGDSGGGNFGFDTVGRPLGIGRGSQSGNSVNSTRDLTVLDEFALNLQSEATAKTQWHGTLVTGNTLGALGQGATLSGRPYQEAEASTYIQALGVDWKAGRAVTGEAGRIGEVGNPYLLRKPDTTPQFDNARWDSPEWLIDGAKMRVPIGDGTLTGFAGRTAAITAVGGANIQDLTFGRTTLPWQPNGTRPIGLLPGAEKVASLYGADFNLPLGTVALGLNYEYELADLTASPVGDNGRGYGATLATTSGPVKLTGGYAKTDLLWGATALVTRRDQAAWASAQYKERGLEAGLGYRYIEPLFGGAGDWGRIGMWWNPTDIKGLQANFATKIAEHLRFYANGGWQTGTGLDVNGQTGLGTGDRLNNYVFGLERPFGEWKATASYETVNWSLQNRTGFNGGTPTEVWYGLGIRRESEHSLLALNWLLSNIDSKGVNGFQLGNDAKANGSLLTAQATLKF